jgi:lipoprotein signal peptidase
MDKVLQELIEFMKSASPVIWQALYKQVYIEAAASFLWAIGLAVLAVVFVRVAKWAMAKKEEDDGYSDWEIVYGFCYILSCATGIVAFSLLVSAIKWIANPEFYAIRFILQSFGGG